jgi:hypothetical protein
LNFNGQTALPPGKERFTERVQLEGDFRVSDTKLTNSSTQGELETLSERVEGEKDDAPEPVFSDLQGHGFLRYGTATFSRLSFHVPGAKARLHGTYSLIDHRIDLHGRLATRASLSRETSGFKSLLLKIAGPFLKKNHRGGGVLDLSVTGSYPHPKYNSAPIPRPM